MKKFILFIRIVSKQDVIENPEPESKKPSKRIKKETKTEDIDLNLMVNITSKTLSRLLVTMTHFHPNVSKISIQNHSNILGNSNLQNTMSMTHSKANSKDSSVIVNNQPSLLKISESNFSAPKPVIFEKQWMLTVFNHKVKRLLNHNLGMCSQTRKCEYCSGR